MSPSIPVPFPSSPSIETHLPLPPPTPLIRSCTSPVHSPRTSQPSSMSTTTTTKRLSMASTTSTRTTATSSSTSRPPALIRTRHTSLPASVVQSRHVSIVGTPANLMANKVKAMNRMSVASVASFGSVEEEADEEEGGNLVESKRSSENNTLRPNPPLSPSRSNVVFGRSGKVPRLRNSLPSNGLPSFAMAMGPTSTVRSNSPLRPAIGDSDAGTSREEKDRRDERRYRIAEELRDTEKAYAEVLEEIDANYYQPLLRALPLDDPVTRRRSQRQSTAQLPTPDVSPRSSVYHTSLTSFASRSRTTTAESTSTESSTATSPPNSQVEPILSRREINEVFSNFTDVLNLSHVMLVTLREAVPERPSQPLTINSDSSTTPLSDRAVGSVESNLSSSGGTIDSSGPDTPHEGAIQDQPRPRTLSQRKSKDKATNRPIAPPLRLGKSLLPIVPFFKQYSLFVANFSSSLARLSALERSSTSMTDERGNNRWNEFVKTRDASEQGGKIGLGGMLLGIVQRVPRYRLLLADLLKYTEVDHPDRKDLELAFNLVDSVATHLDSQIESHTHDLSLLNLQRSFLNLDFALLSPGRRLLKSGNLRKITRNGTEQDRAFFLFNDLILHASIESNGSSWSFAGGLTNSYTGEGIQYRLIGRFELEDVTVIGTEEGSLRHGFEILTTQRSFAVYADSSDSRSSWLDAIRDAKAALMSDRRTLQRATIFDPILPPPPPSSNSASTSSSPKTDRRISLPAAAKTPTTHLPTPPPRRHVSHKPELSPVPPTPADERDGLDFGRPITPSPSREGTAPIAFPVTPTHPRSASATSPSATTAPPPPLSDLTSSPSRRPSLARVRRWSEMRPSTAVSALASAFSPSLIHSAGGGGGDLTNDEVEYKVVESYHAPVWVPDHKAKKCLNCREPFGVWRRRHHCRLCGGVVCWACSTKYFIIPGSLLTSSSQSSKHGIDQPQSQQSEDRLARSCDSCYSAVFDDPVPASRFLGGTTPATFGRSTLQPCIDKTATLHRLSRIVKPREMLPIFDDDQTSFLNGGRGSNPPSSGAPSVVSARPQSSTPTKLSQAAELATTIPTEVPKRRRRLTAAGELRQLLSQ